MQTYHLTLPLAVKNMKISFSSVLLLAVMVSALPEPQTVCAAVCQPTRPVCQSGWVASGSEGCWGCCQPEPTTCLAVCQPTRPVCQSGWVASGSETCWGCCRPVAET